MFFIKWARVLWNVFYWEFTCHYPRNVWSVTDGRQLTGGSGSSCGPGAGAETPADKGRSLEPEPRRQIRAQQGWIFWNFFPSINPNHNTNVNGQVPPNFLLFSIGHFGNFSHQTFIDVPFFPQWVKIIKLAFKCRLVVEFLNIHPCKRTNSGTNV